MTFWAFGEQGFSTRALGLLGRHFGDLWGLRERSLLNSSAVILQNPSVTMLITSQFTQICCFHYDAIELPCDRLLSRVIICTYTVLV